MTTFCTPFYTTVCTVVEVEADSFEEAYTKGLDSSPPHVYHCERVDQEECEIDHENIKVVDE